MRIFPDTTGMATGLCLFGAGFGGENDARWLKEDGVRGTVVDNDKAAIERMRSNYPDNWKFRCEDVYVFLIDAITRKEHFDVISVDQPVDQTTKVHRWLPQIWTLVNKMLVVVAPVKSEPPAFARNIEHIIRSNSWEWWVIRK
jgi:hypothetical protein